MRFLFWAAVALFTAIAAHAAFILEAPAYSLGHTIARISAKAGGNAFFILPPEEQAKLLPAYPRQGVVGVCAFDVSQSNVDLQVNVPDGFWTLTIYSSRGGIIYTVNNAQAGLNFFNVALSKAPDLIEMLVQATEKEPIDADTGWTVSSPSERGLAVLWYPVDEPAERAGVMREIERSACKPVAKPAA